MRKNDVLEAGHNSDKYVCLYMILICWKQSKRQKEERKRCKFHSLDYYAGIKVVLNMMQQFGEVFTIY